MRSRQLLASALAALVVAATAASSSAHAGTALFRLSDRTALAVTVDAGRMRARLAPGTDARAHGGSAVAVDPRLASELRRATDLVAVAGRGFDAGGRTYVVLGVALPSVNRHGSGYCGAGTEDFLFLIEWTARPRKVVLRDRLQVQSCLQSMVLQSDQGDVLRVVLRGIDDPAQVVLTWLQHPRYGPATKTVTVNDGQFVILP